ncbi:AraC family transcriptional regulator ligand-binding domain-containing protein [Zhongshania sp.]|uniref:AraC family transcriptional regulator n=1 Tax=Zhongshania sp. TaxID=1971902 RepID=UPI0035624506
MEAPMQPTPLNIAEQGCFPPNYSRLIARVLGIDAHKLPTLLAQTDVSANQLLREDTLLTSKQQIQILKNALCISNDQMFGLRLGKYLTPNTHGAMGFMASSSPNLLATLKAFQTYLPTRVDFSHIKLKLTKEYWECYCYFETDLDADILRAISEIYASVLFQCAEFIVGMPIEYAKICFSFKEPDYSQRYSEFLPGLIEFSSPELIFKIPKNICEIPNASANHESYSLALRECQSMLDKMRNKTNSITHQIEKMMLTHPPGVLNENRAAAMLFISERTLARRLTQEGSNFRTIRDQILSQQASSYLRNSDMSVDAIAALLNYHDSSSFRRAFKRWFHLTPDQYRKSKKS